MLYWQRISCVLCFYGFLRELRPADPYYIEYLLSSRFKFTVDEVNKVIVPVLTYSYMAQLVIILLITDYYRYKPIILITSFAGVIGYSMLIFAQTKELVIASNFFFGTFVSGEIPYYTYIYSKVDKEHYSLVTAQTRAALLMGKCLACFMAQVSIDYDIFTYRDLNMITLITQACSFLWAFRLKRAAKSLYFHRHFSIVNPGRFPIPAAHQALAFTQNSTEDEELARRLSNISDKEFERLTAAQLLWKHVKVAYSDKQVLIWSIFFATGMCGYLQVYNYIQVLWRDIDPEPRPWNAAVDGLLRLFGAIAAFGVGCINSSRISKRKLLCLAATLAITQGSVLIFACYKRVLVISYVCYIAFGVLHCLLTTIASAEVAKRLEGESFALIFGLNTFFALVIQTILTVAYVSNLFISVNVTDQFIIDGCYYIVVGVAYFFFDGYDYYASKSRRTTVAR